MIANLQSDPIAESLVTPDRALIICSYVNSMDVISLSVFTGNSGIGSSSPSILVMLVK